MGPIEYYKNTGKPLCITIPPRLKKKYLIKDNYLSEFSSEEEINLVLNNLGINTKLDIIRQLIEDKSNEIYGTIDNNVELTHSKLNNMLTTIYNKLNDILIDIYGRFDDYSTISYLETRLAQTTSGFSQEKAKGCFESESDLPYPENGDWAIIIDSNAFKIKIAYCKERGNWTFFQEKEIDLSPYVLKQDLDIYATKELLDEKLNFLVSGENIKTINGETLIGPGNIQISGDGEPIDLSNYMTKEEYLENLSNYITKEEYLENFSKFMTKEEYEDILNPLRVSLSTNISLSEYTGEDIPIKLSYNITKAGKPIIPNSLELYKDNVKVLDVELSATGTINQVVNKKGITKFSIKADDKSADVSINLVIPSYIGFDSSEVANNVNLSNLVKEIKASISNVKTIQNSTAGNYLWIISPYTLNLVATDSGFTYLVSMISSGTINNLKYYRSELAIDISNLTYYIK